MVRTEMGYGGWLCMMEVGGGDGVLNADGGGKLVLE